MNIWFSWLQQALEGMPIVALLSAGLWGALSVILSPCHLAGLPLIIGFITGEKDISSRRALYASLAFAAGVLCSVALIGLVTVALGRMAGDIGPLGGWVAAGTCFLVGLHLLEVIQFPSFSNTGAFSFRFRGVGAAWCLGLLFGVALGPCTFAFMVPVLALAFKVASTLPLYAVALVAAYGVGHCAVIAVAGVSVELVRGYMRWSAGGLEHARKVCGVLVLVGGLYLLYRA